MAHYREKIYGKYTSIVTRAGIEGAAKDFLEKSKITFEAYFKNYLPQNKKAKILDAGCGHGSVVYFLQQQGYENVIGIDISQEQIAVGQKLGVKNIKVADIRQYLDNYKNEFDLISLLDVLEHFDKNEILPVLGKIHKALRPGGKLMIRTTNAESIFSGIRRYGDFTHETSFTTRSLKEVLSITGFQKTNFYSVEPFVHGIKSFIRFICWKVVKVFLRTYLIIETGSPGSGILSQNLIAVAEK